MDSPLTNHQLELQKRQRNNNEKVLRKEKGPDRSNQTGIRVTRKVFIPNRSGHDFESAKSHGTLVYITEGQVSKYNISRMYSVLVEEMQYSHRNDLILMTGLSHMCAIACSIFAHLHGRLNLLLHVGKGEYITRTVVLSELLNKKNKKEG